LPRIAKADGVAILQQRKCLNILDSRTLEPSWSGSCFSKKKQCFARLQ